MIILHLITSLRIGGAEVALCNFLEKVAPDSSNRHVVVYFHPGPIAARLTAFGLTVIQVRGLLSPYDPLGLWRLCRCVAALKPDVIHSALWSANVLGRLIAHRFKLPIICDLHGNSSDEGWLRNFLERRTAHLSTAIVAVSSNTHNIYYENIIRRLPTKKQHFVEKKLTIIHNGIDRATLHRQAAVKPLTRAALGLTGDDFVVGAVGRLEPIKSYDVLIKAFALFINETKTTSAKLCIVGGGSQAAALTLLVAQEKIDFLTIFTGQQDNACRFYPLFNCFVLSSQSEGMSIALLEALAFGLPVITTNQEPSHDVITHGINGFIVPPNAPQQLATALKLLYENHELIKSMRLKNSALVEEKFSLETTIKSFKKLYSECK